jgi:hypothetical protein
MAFIKELGQRSFETTDGGKSLSRFAIPTAFVSQRSAAPQALLLGDHLKPMNLNLGKQPLRIRRKFLSSLAVQMSFSGNFIIEGVEDYIYSRLTFVFRRVPRQRSSFSSYQLGLPV